MNEKETLITIINQKGSCREPLNISCNDCEFCSTKICINRDLAKIYKQAIKMFVKNYGEENLTEVLL